MFNEEFNKVAGAAKAKNELLKNNKVGYLVSAMLAGLFVGMAIMLIFTIGGLLSSAGSPATKIVMGIAFGGALSLVVMAGSELFTGNNFVMAVGSLNKTVSWMDTIKVWIAGFIGNLAGSILAGYMFYLTGLATGPGALSKENNAGRSENSNVSASASKNDDRYINNKYINNNNKLYIYIFNAWNKLNINNEKILTDDNKSAIANALNEHNEEDIINAIENFGVVYKSDHYYNYAWILKSFLSRSNGINRFMEDGDIWLDYKAKQKNVKRNSIFPEDFDIEKYID